MTSLGQKLITCYPKIVSLLRIAFADYHLVIPDTSLSWTSAGVEEGASCCPSDLSPRRESVAVVETLMMLSATSLF